MTLLWLGDCQRDLGQIAHAHRSWRQAVTVFTELGAAEVDQAALRLEPPS